VEFERVEGLKQVMVESGLAAPLPVRFLAVARRGNQQGAVPLRQGM
jgi:hypothetical protein